MKTLLTSLLVFLVAGCAGLNPTAIEGTIKIQLSKETLAWRAEQKKLRMGKAGRVKFSKGKERVVINGKVVNQADYPAIIRIESETGAICTATIIGPQAILTAAHCGDIGEKFTFKTVDGKNYSGTYNHYENWSEQDDLDISIGKVSTTITGVKPLEVATVAFEKKGLYIELFGFGCVTKGGGLDGNLRTGTAVIVGSSGYDVEFTEPPPATSIIKEVSALCSGDSGGPGIYAGKVRFVNSKGNLVDRSWLTRLSPPLTKTPSIPGDWLAQKAKELGLLVCGVNTQCGTNTPIPPVPVPPAPTKACKDFVVDNEYQKVTGVCK